MSEGRRVAALGLALFALNVFVCYGLFRVEFAATPSNEAAFIAISRFYREHWTNLDWFPWFDAGMPIENAYQPLLPAITALLSAAGGLPIGRAFHVVVALTYCMGPVTLFWFIWDWARSATLSFTAALLYSLISPGAMLFASVRAASGGFWTAQRLFNLVFYGEIPHTLALMLLPVALLFLRRAMERRDIPGFTGALISCSAVVLTNAFGAFSLALGVVCIALALRRGLAIGMAIGIAAYCWCSPWLPPSLAETIRRNAWSARGQYGAGLPAYTALFLLFVAFGAVWWTTRRSVSSFERFAWLFLVWMSAFPAAYFIAGISLVPQSHRYVLEMELAICMALGLLCVRVMKSGHAWRKAVKLSLLALALHQLWTYRSVAASIIQPVEITRQLEYKVAMWIDKNLPGQRTMVSGDAAWLFNVFSDNPQMSAGHEPTAPNFIQQIAVYQLYSGMNAGSRDADVSLLWLKAFGNQAVTVPGPGTREIYHPFANAKKFDGILPVLWREEGDTIYAVPQRTRSLAHVIPMQALVRARPVNGLDTNNLGAYVAALDDPQMPAAEMTWLRTSKARISTEMAPGQILSVQVNYDPGWHARIGEAPKRVEQDGLGLMAIDAGCAGPCRIDLEYGTTPAVWICRVLSWLVWAGLFGMITLHLRRARVLPR